jgi:hypothetical protein
MSIFSDIDLPPTLCPFSQDNKYELESDFFFHTNLTNMKVTGYFGIERYVLFVKVHNNEPIMFMQDIL